MLDAASILTQAFEHRGRIRQLAREYLSAEARRVYDSEDLLATVYRRILEADPTSASEAQTWEFIRTIATHAARSQTRRAAVRSRGVANAGPAASPPQQDLTIQEVLDALPDPEMQQVVALRSRGARFRVVAAAMAISERTAFRRWSEARQILKDKGYDLVQ